MNLEPVVRAGLLGLLLPPVDPDPRFQLNLSASFETFATVGYVVPGVRYDSVFRPAAGFDVELARSYIWLNRFIEYDVTLRPLVGYSYRSFAGDNWTNSAGNIFRPDNLAVQTVYGGAKVGAGWAPAESSLGLITYLNLQAGVSFIDPVRVEAPGAFAGREVLFDRSWTSYLSGGIGLEGSYDRFDLHVEFGFRTFGNPTRVSTVVVAREDKLIVAYLAVGAGLAY